MEAEKVRSADDSRVPTIRSFELDPDTGQVPEGAVYLYEVPDYCQVQDANGNRFRKMGYGFVQGAIVVRDRYRTMYQTDSTVIVRQVGR